MNDITNCYSNVINDMNSDLDDMNPWFCWCQWIAPGWLDRGEFSLGPPWGTPPGPLEHRAGRGQRTQRTEILQVDERQ